VIAPFGELSLTYLYIGALFMPTYLLGFKAGEVVSTQRVLLDFSVAVDELLA
jgi:hypothetical protein